MRQAKVNLVSLGIFSWALLEPEEGVFDFCWLDRIMDDLHATGVQVALATGTAAPPAWLALKHPEILPVTADCTVLHQGSRRHYSPSSPVYLEYARGITRALAERYKDHPALALWHVDNELGCHVSEFYGDDDAAAFREWLRQRYGSVEALNAAWGTAFWSQHYTSFDQVQPPRVTPTSLNPTQRLDFQRFSSWALIVFYRGLLEVIREVTPDIPATTNLMASSATKSMDYFSWAPSLDVIANDHYLIAADLEGFVELAFSADLTRGIAGGRPWMLMEHSTSAVNWQPRNRRKLPGEMKRNSLAHVARGADAVMFFQWRQSAAGAEKFHSAMVPHAGTASRVWQEVVELGAAVEALEPVRGSVVEAKVALVFDYEAWWASELDSHPSTDVHYLDQLRAFHRELWLRGVTVDVVHPSAPLAGYSLVLVCTLYTVSDVAVAAVADAAAAGATVLVTYFSGIVDEQDHVRLGGYPGAFRELLGIRTEEFAPLLQGETVLLDGGSTGSIWTEDLALEGAEPVARYADGPLAGVPAITRRRTGSGAAWYLATSLDSQGLADLVDRLLNEADVAPAAVVPPGVEAVRRRQPDGTGFLFLINHTTEAATVGTTGTDLFTGSPVVGQLELAAGAVAVIRED